MKAVVAVLAVVALSGCAGTGDEPEQPQRLPQPRPLASLVAFAREPMNVDLLRARAGPAPRSS